LTKQHKRLEQAVADLSPEDKARWLLEGPLLGAEISKAEEQRLLSKMTPEDGRRYNAYIARWDRLRRNMATLLTMAMELKEQLLLRDRILWYWRGVLDLQESLVFGHGKALLEDNPNVKPGKTMELGTMAGAVRLGVSGKDRLPFGKSLGAEMRERMQETLDLNAKGIRQLAAEGKALGRYLTEEAQAMELSTVGPFVADLLDELREYDRPLLKEIAQGKAPALPPGALFPVDQRWALVWEDIQEDAETARRVRADPDGWQPKSVDRLLGGRTLSEFWQGPIGRGQCGVD
jgi:hypothetical protein